MPIAIARTQSDLGPYAGCVLVPTMGALHAGHRALIQRASAYASDLAHRPAVVVSLFVNPTQFNQAGDYQTYPRDLERDLNAASEAGADCLFAPDVETVYPPGARVPVPDLPPAATEPGLEDVFRPGHFAGVCQVVARLLDLARPQAAVFGEKDWQQLVVVRQMAADTHPGVRILAHPTVREPDGLALSSRNARLSSTERERARAISGALAEAARRPEDPASAEAGARRVLLEASVDVEYCVVRDQATLGAPRPGHAARTLIAANFGDARLIDNAPWPGFRLDGGDAIGASPG